MTEKKSRKALYLFFSIAVSIALWTYVVYIGNPMLEEPVPVSNVKIEFTGEDLLRDNDLIVSSISARDLTVYFSGRLRDKTKISNLEVRAVVDLADVLDYHTPTGTHSLDYELIYDSGTSKFTVDHVSIPSVDVTVEQLITNNIQIRPMFEGSIAENYMAGALTLSRDTVSVAGTEAAINRIDRATATIAMDDLSYTVTKEVNIELFDADGEKIDAEEAGITFVNGETVHITQTVLMVKDVAFEIDLVETPTVNDSNISVNIEPASIRLSGDPEVLEGLNVINLGTVDLKSFYTSYSEQYQIKLPNNTNNLSGFTSVNVRIDIKDSNIEIRRLSTANISYRNAGDGDTVEILNDTIPVVIRGDSETIARVMEENIRIVADLSNVAGSKGAFEVPAKAYVDGFSNASGSPMVDAVGEYKVNVFIS